MDNARAVFKTDPQILFIVFSWLVNLTRDGRCHLNSLRQKQNRNSGHEYAFYRVLEGLLQANPPARK